MKNKPKIQLREEAQKFGTLKLSNEMCQNCDGTGVWPGENKEFPLVSPFGYLPCIKCYGNGWLPEMDEKGNLIRLTDKEYNEIHSIWKGGRVAKCARLLSE